MKNNEKISIIVPIYNIEEYVSRCIDSILKQTYSNLDIVLVDDGSTDNCSNICDEYAKKDNRIRVFHKENGGLSDARNFGIKYAKGKYISFIDGDDFVAEDFIYTLYQNLIKYNADISVCGYSIYNNGIINKFEKNNQDYIIELKPKYAIKYMLDNNFAFRHCTWNKLYKIELFKNISFPYKRIYEDVGTTYKLICKSKKVVYDSSSKYYYVKNYNSITNTHIFDKKELDRIEMSNQMCDYCVKKYNKDISLKHLLEKFRSCQYIYCLDIMIRNNKYDKSYVNITKKILKKNILSIIKKGSIKEIFQCIILIINFNLYKTIFKLIIKVKSYRS